MNNRIEQIVKHVWNVVVHVLPTYFWGFEIKTAAYHLDQNEHSFSSTKELHGQIYI